MPSRSSSSRSERSSCFVVVSSRNAANISVEPAIVLLHGNRGRRLPTAAQSHQQRRFAASSSSASVVSAALAPAGASRARRRAPRRSRPRAARRAPATGPGRGARRTGASAPASAAAARGPARTPPAHSAGPTRALDSRNRSRDRLIPAQSSAVTPWPGRLSGRSTRTCRMGRCSVPARLRSTSSKPRPSRWSRIGCEQRVDRHRERKKNVGELPHIAQSARTGAPGTARETTAVSAGSQVETRSRVPRFRACRGTRPSGRRRRAEAR